MVNTSIDVGMKENGGSQGPRKGLFELYMPQIALTGEPKHSRKFSG